MTVQELGSLSVRGYVYQEVQDLRGLTWFHNLKAFSNSPLGPWAKFEVLKMYQVSSWVRSKACRGCDLSRIKRSRISFKTYYIRSIVHGSTAFRSPQLARCKTLNSRPHRRL
jgi:hypothetical protein